MFCQCKKFSSVNRRSTLGLSAAARCCPKECQYARFDPVCPADLALPDRDVLPAHFRQSPSDLGISPDIAIEFRRPELFPGFGNPRSRAATMRMPETTIDEDDLPARGEDQIGLARQRRGMQAVAVAQSVDEPADGHLGRCSRRANASHYLAATLLGHGVHSLSQFCFAFWLAYAFGVFVPPPTRKAVVTWFRYVA